MLNKIYKFTGKQLLTASLLSVPITSIVLWKTFEKPNIKVDTNVTVLPAMCHVPPINIQVVLPFEQKIEQQTQLKAVKNITKDDLLNTLTKGKNTPWKVFKKKLYAVESDNNYTAVEPRQKKHFGVCQLSDLLGQTYALKIKTVWLREKTPPNIQDKLCKMHVDSLKYKDTDLLKYMNFQLGGGSTSQVLKYLLGERKDIDFKIKTYIWNNLSATDRKKYTTTVPTLKLLTLWVDRFKDQF